MAKKSEYSIINETIVMIERRVKAYMFSARNISILLNRGRNTQDRKDSFPATVLAADFPEFINIKLKLRKIKF